MLLGLALLLAGLPARAEQALRFAPVSVLPFPQLESHYAGALQYFSERSGTRIRLLEIQDYDDIIHAFSKDEIDLTFLGPGPLLKLLQDSAAAEVLAQAREGPGVIGYRCALVVFDANVQGFADLRGSTLATPQHSSTCSNAFALPWFLRQSQMAADAIDQRVFPTHEEAARAVVLGQARAGIVKDRVAESWASLGLHLVQQSPRVPGFALVANRNTVPAKLREALRQAALDLDPARDSGTALLTRGWGPEMRHGFAPLSEIELATFRDALQRALGPAPDATDSHEHTGPGQGGG